MVLGPVGILFSPILLSKPRYISRNNLDIQKWDTLISESIVSLGYAYTWYLDEICENWGALVLGNYDAVMPLPHKRKYGLPYIYQPRFIQQLGVFCRHKNDMHTSMFFQSIPRRFVLAEFFVNPFFGTHPSAQQRINLVLPLAATYQELYNNFARDAQKNIRKTSDITFQPGQNLKESIALYQQVYGPLNPHITPAHYASLLAACQAAQLHGKLVHTKFYSQGQFLGMGLLLLSGNRLHHFCAAPTEEGRQRGVMHAYINYIIKTYAGQALILDFEGSQIPNVAYFYSKFNPQEENYLHIKRYPILGI
jgi:hypothetical protein